MVFYIDNDNSDKVLIIYYILSFLTITGIINRLLLRYIPLNDKNSFLDKCLSIHSLLLQNGVDSGITFKKNESECFITVNGKSKRYTSDDDIDIDTEFSALEKF